MNQNIFTYVLIALTFIMIASSIFTNWKNNQKNDLSIVETVNKQQAESKQDVHVQTSHDEISYEEQYSEYQHHPVGDDHNHETNESEMIQVNETMKNFTLNSLHHGKVSINQYKGKKLFINFWTTWCSSCREEMPEIQNYYDTYSKQHNVEVISINVTHQDRSVEVIKDFADYYQLSFPILLDEQGDVSKSFKILTIPTSFIVNEQGVIEQKIMGPITTEMLVQVFESS